MRTLILSLSLALAACNAASAAPDHLPTPAPAAPGARCPLAINEVAPAGKPTDWVELVNVSDQPIDLSAFAFIDRTRDPARAARLPATVLAPGGRHVQEVTSRDQGFRLGAEDALYLYRAGEVTACDQVAWDDEDAPTSSSFARLPDGTGGFDTASPDTRGVANR